MLASSQYSDEQDIIECEEVGSEVRSKEDRMKAAIKNGRWIFYDRYLERKEGANLTMLVWGAIVLETATKMDSGNPAW